MTNQHNFTENERKMSVRDMDFSTRTLNALLGNDIHSLQDLLDAIDNDELKRMYHIGAVVTKEVYNKVAEIQTAKYHDFKENIAAIKSRNEDINAKIKEYKKVIAKLENEQKYNDKMIVNLQTNYNKTL